jgi:hypothetical protein
LLSYFFLDDDFFFPEDFFFEGVFFEEDFFLEADFLAGTFAPALRASERPMAIACLRLVTFLPDFPLLRVPCFFSCMTFFTFDCAFLPYWAIVLSWAVRATYRIQCPPAHLEQDRFQMFQRKNGLRIEAPPRTTRNGEIIAAMILLRWSHRTEPMSRARERPQALACDPQLSQVIFDFPPSL